ncbi:hypothetical protein LINPERPRIM_LOCUS21280 [Linum perenne]
MVVFRFSILRTRFSWSGLSTPMITNVPPSEGRGRYSTTTSLWVFGHQSSTRRNPSGLFSHGFAM